MGETGGGTIRIGVGGWTYEPWRGTFYPDKHPHKRELDYASRRLTSIEINGTFYRTQTRDTFRKWHDETPDDFVFALKAPRYATNRPLLASAGSSVERFFASGVDELKQKLGPINWQFLPGKTFDAADFEAFLELLPKSIVGRDLRHAVEVRHPSFRTPEFVAVARARGVAIVVAGDSRYPLIADITAPFVYARAQRPIAWTGAHIRPHSDGRQEPRVGGLAPQSRRRRCASRGHLRGRLQSSRAPWQARPG